MPVRSGYITVYRLPGDLAHPNIDALKTIAPIPSEFQTIMQSNDSNPTRDRRPDRPRIPDRPILLFHTFGTPRYVCLLKPTRLYFPWREIVTSCPGLGTLVRLYPGVDTKIRLRSLREVRRPPTRHLHLTRSGAYGPFASRFRSGFSIRICSPTFRRFRRHVNYRSLPKPPEGLSFDSTLRLPIRL
jgi:hypothetical protein